MTRARNNLSESQFITAMRAEIETRFEAMKIRFDGIDRATDLVKEDYVRVPTVVDKAILGLREVLEARIASLEKLQELMRSAMRSGPDVIEEAIHNLELLMDQKIATSSERLEGKIMQHVGETAEKFVGVTAQFSERDARADQRAGDSKLAVDAAFAAAKEATSKIELGFTKQIDSMILAMDTLAKNLDSKISDVKDTIQDLKERAQALESRGAGVHQQATESGARMFSIIAIIVAATVGIAEVVSRLAH